MRLLPLLLALLLLLCTGCIYWAKLPIEESRLTKELIRPGYGPSLLRAARRKVLIVRGEERLVIKVQYVKWPHAYYYDRRKRQERSVNLLSATEIYIRKDWNESPVLRVGAIIVALVVFIP